MKLRPFCENCRDSGWDRNARSGDYDGVCSDCGGQAVYVAKLASHLVDARAVADIDFNLIVPHWFSPMVGIVGERRLAHWDLVNDREESVYGRVWDSP